MIHLIGQTMILSTNLVPFSLCPKNLEILVGSQMEGSALVC